MDSYWQHNGSVRICGFNNKECIFDFRMPDVEKGTVPRQTNIDAWMPLPSYSEQQWQYAAEHAQTEESVQRMMTYSHVYNIRDLMCMYVLCLPVLVCTVCVYVSDLRQLRRWRLPGELKLMSVIRSKQRAKQGQLIQVRRAGLLVCMAAAKEMKD